MRRFSPNQLILACIIAASALLFQGCRYVIGSNANNYTTVRVFYATDRNRTSSRGPQKMYGVARGEMSYGTCEINIQKDHRMGQFETMSSWRLDFQEDPAKHVVLSKVSPLASSNFFASVRSRIQSSPTKNAFIFVHGYNVTFEEAARNTAQLAYDLGLDAAPVFYSWPSQGTLVGYPKDEANIEWSQGNLERFLNDFAANTDAENIYLIGHSMGNRALTRAFAALIAQQPAVRTKFKELILMAPDIDAEVFKREIAPAIVSTNTPSIPLVTLYCSACDSALRASQSFHGYQRLGDSKPQPVVVPGMDTIDVTTVDTSFIGHSYYAEDRSVISDMFYLIRDATPASKKPRVRLQKAGSSTEQYWEFRP